MFSLNSLNFVTIFFVKRSFEHVTCYHKTNKTQVTNRIFKLKPINVSVIYQIPRIQWISVPFGDKSNTQRITNSNLFVQTIPETRDSIEFLQNMESQEVTRKNHIY